MFMLTVHLLLGILLVLAGRNIFWKFVEAVNLFLGEQCVEWFMVIFIVGFLGGGYLLVSLLPLTIQQDSYSGFIFVLGGITGMCLMIIAFDWALVLISSLLGTTLIAHVFHGSEELHKYLFFVSAGMGIVIQYFSLRSAGSQKQATSIN